MELFEYKMRSYEWILRSNHTRTDLLHRKYAVILSFVFQTKHIANVATPSRKFFTFIYSWKQSRHIRTTPNTHVQLVCVQVLHIFSQVPVQQLLDDTFKHHLAPLTTAHWVKFKVFIATRYCVHLYSREGNETNLD